MNIKKVHKNFPALKKILFIISVSFFFSAADFVFSITLFSVKEKNDPGDAERTSDKTIIATVAGRYISLKDFIERAEYTLRPPYCRGSSNNDKNIILNSLIAEKLLAQEAIQDSGLFGNEKFLNFISGRREQKMREMLYYYEGEKKVSVDSAEIKKVYSVAGRTYRIQYLNFKDKRSADNFAEKWELSDSALESSLKNFNLLDSIPEREISWNSQEIFAVHNALFSDKLQKGQIIGPLSTDDTTHLLIKIKGWSDRIAVSQTDFMKRWTDVEERLTRVKADSIYDKFVRKVMENKRLDFNGDIFYKMAAVMAPFYSNQKRADDANKFLSNIENPELPDPELLGADYFGIKDYPVLKIDDKFWTVADLKKEIDKHPLVLRSDSRNSGFAAQLRLAIVDLVRDKYLAEIAYKRSYHETEIVKHYEQIWVDASIALFKRSEYLNTINSAEITESEIFEKYLNPFIEKLLKKYSDQIKINVDEYNKIRLTHIDMFVIQPDVPYTVYVPAFPPLTTYNRLDYGKKMYAADSSLISNNR